MSSPSDPIASPGSFGERLPVYVLVTPARNEAATIEQTIRSVIHQVLPPAEWIIVSDGSTDGTDEIVSAYASRFPWIRLYRMPPRAERHFGGKALAFNAGYDLIRASAFDVVGSLDADIAFDEDYFRFLMNKFDENPALGVAGTPFVQGSFSYDYRFSRKEHVSGACQLFRRACFESIGGYRPLREGGIDLVAVVTARMNGWKTETFPEKYCRHLRPMGTAGPHYLKYMFRGGYGDFMLGVHPAWQFFRSVYQMRFQPIFLSGFLILTGYAWGMMTNPAKPVSEAFVRFRREEQRRWLKDYARKLSSRVFHDR